MTAIHNYQDLIEDTSTVKAGDFLRLPQNNMVTVLNDGVVHPDDWITDWEVLWNSTKYSFYFSFRKGVDFSTAKLDYYNLASFVLEADGYYHAFIHDFEKNSTRYQSGKKPGGNRVLFL